MEPKACGQAPGTDMRLGDFRQRGKREGSAGGTQGHCDRVARGTSRPLSVSEPRGGSLAASDTLPAHAERQEEREAARAVEADRAGPQAGRGLAPRSSGLLDALPGAALQAE